jgi:hypothetical protein
MIRHLWSRHRWLCIGFVAMVLLALLFGLRATVRLNAWSGDRDEAIAGWMTPRYVAMNWDVPPDVIASALDLERDGNGRRVTLAEIAAERGETLNDLAAELEEAINAFRAGP